MKLFDKLFKNINTDLSINKDVIVKEKITEERISLFTGTWDSKRLLRELLRIANSVNMSQIKLSETYTKQSPYEIECKRVFSVINAFNNCKIEKTDQDFILFEELILKDYSKNKISELISFIKTILTEDKFAEELITLFNKEIRINQDEEYTNRIHLFRFLFEYRLENYKLYTHWNKVLATDFSGEIAIRITRKLYNEKIECVNDVLDKLLLLLLGDGYNKTFTEIELLKNYGYPNITDTELHKIELEF